MPMKLHHGYFSVAGCQADPDALFVFGDNLERTGKGGQATIRDCANAIGLASKIAPRRDDDAFFADANADLFLPELRRFHQIVAPHLKAGGTVWWPADGIGTGLSEMPARAPALYARMCQYSRGLFDLQGTESYVSAIVCGGRDYQDRKTAFAGLDDRLGSLRSDGVMVEVIEGAAKGADRLAGLWADERGIAHTKVPADWNKYGKRAGFLRNDEMATRLQARRDQAGVRALTIGMPGGRGTEMMLRIAGQKGFEVSRISADPSFSEVPTPVRKGAGKPRVEKSEATTSQQELDL